MQNVTKIGVVGFSGKPFDINSATEKLRSILGRLNTKFNDGDIELVSGYTNIGIPKIAYEIADELGMITVGISAKEALNVDCGLYPVKKKIIVGDHFGDESDTFIEYIDILIRIGGGNQSLHEVKLFKQVHNHKQLDDILLEEEVN